MRTALITGITGQDGAYLSEFLLEKGYEVWGIVRDSADINLRRLIFLGIENRVKILPSNLSDISSIIRILEKVTPDEIYNLAAQSSVGLSFEQPISTISFNILSTANLLEAVRMVNPAIKFYQASSSEMYGKVKKMPINEESILHPVSPYAISKASSHWLTVNYREAYDLFSCCGVLFNHESFLRGNHFVTKKIVTSAVRIKKGYNEKLTLGNINIKRDWGYAPEYVKAMWLMLQSEIPDDYVIATGKPNSLKEFVQLSFSCLGLNWEDHVLINETLYRPSEIESIYGDASKAKIKLNWNYNISFKELVKLLVDQEIIYYDSIKLK